MAVSNVSGEVVLVDHLAHVFQDLSSRGDGRTRPRLEAVAERIEIAIGANAGIAMSMPSTAKGVLCLEHHKASIRTLLSEVVGTTDPRDACADNQHVEMLIRISCPRVHAVHPPPARFRNVRLDRG